MKQQLREWIAGKASVNESELENSTDFLGEGMLASVEVLDLIFLIEELSGQEVDVSDVQPEYFQNINSLYSSFFERP